MKRWAKSGSPWIWLTAGSVAVSLLALIGIMLLLAGQGMRYFWPSPVYQFELNQSAAGPVTMIGELYQQQSIPRRQLLESGIALPPGNAQSFERYLIKVGNRESEGQDFRTLLAGDIVRQSTPRDLLVLERNNNGTAYGYLAGMLEDGQPLTGRNLSQALLQRLPQIAALSRQAHDIQFRDMARINQRFDMLRLREKSLQREDKLDARAQASINAERLELQRQYRLLSDRLEGLNRDRHRDALLLRDMHGQTHTIALSQVRDAWYPNAMNTTQKLVHWAEQVKKFLSDSPREANTEGGVFPAIFGTVLMVILMSIVVMPFGVIAAVYLHEYAGNNLLTRLIRIAVVNLAGVPSIVYGVFGLGFFVYMIGGTLDQLFYPESLPNPTFGTPGVLWAALTLALLTLPVVIVATEEGLSRIPASLRQGSLALGASRAETLWRIVLPMAAPAMMTGLILAVARAAGETAPLMLVGVVKSVPVLPVDDIFPYLHLERKFMHLSFQIYDMAFQSPSVEAARPLVFATAFLLVAIVVGLNLAAMGIRHSLRERYRAWSQ
ncbi:TPA: phosphate ABC transporter permease PstA [Serratia liquefaciens]|jgi:phosphate transport system permease protein|uniref:Phosphate transport system permease protein PstA n=1 Tax=Serratia liquefaciens TaxID=614 RepID=A0ABX7D6L1_SERLI|nr:phosphate ABC transporter permease PstA [Serratia liquefaciens]MBI6162702.1 phosphate ABC transporter permease PstA [Serratia liquefaciens]QQU56431.1 phosphate ABC transporter permease PstA [Serratia liquefaciens]RYM68579.1 phosphate ABC transporter, permease protein PstA [Serratia liquefaciens]RYM77354.1 phosphate ABC transporter, permease protein PstA [Serratia liquefaciens]HED2336894.1 phosphate ABC transporter permease PstA [Serratia liquefaciens]